MNSRSPAGGGAQRHARLKQSEALIDNSIDYGLPGKPSYTYTRPSQTRGTIGIFYTFLGHERFGAVDWRLMRLTNQEPTELRRDRGMHESCAALSFTTSLRTA